jgi:hypothetical protein
MAYTVRVRGVEIMCDTLDDLDAIVDRYGSTDEAPTSRLATGTKNGSASSASGGKGGDNTLLKTLVEAGTAGVRSTVIGHMISAKGKGFTPALRRWAVRVGFTDAESNFPLEQARPDGARGWRLKEGALVMARDLVK